MPRVIDYQLVRERMLASGFVSLYHNSGAFGFASDKGVATFGWIGAADPTIRNTDRWLLEVIPPPHDVNLADRLGRVCTELATTAWLMPKSHWHYELHFGNRELLESLLADLKIDVATLVDRNDGSAIEFSPEEFDSLQRAGRALLDGLRGSDFLIAFPDAQTLCTIHHHQQLWWQTRRPALFTKST